VKGKESLGLSVWEGGWMRWLEGPIREEGSTSTGREKNWIEQRGYFSKKAREGFRGSFLAESKEKQRKK